MLIVNKDQLNSLIPLVILPNLEIHLIALSEESTNATFSIYLGLVMINPFLPPNVRGYEQHGIAWLRTYHSLRTAALRRQII